MLHNKGNTILYHATDFKWHSPIPLKKENESLDFMLILYLFT